MLAGNRRDSSASNLMSRIRDFSFGERTTGEAHAEPITRLVVRAFYVPNVRNGPAAVIIQPLFDPYRAILVELAARHRLALMSPSRENTLAGGVISISANWLLLYKRAAVYVDKIIRGAKPGELPVEQPTNFQVT